MRSGVRHILSQPKREICSVVSSFLLCMLLRICPAQTTSRAAGVHYAPSVERWGMEEVTLHTATRYDNPFRDATVSGHFVHGSVSITVSGFYDGANTWRIRFMPQDTGVWKFEVDSSDSAMNGLRGSFTVNGAGPGNHGPVAVANTYHFSYADGTPFFVLGTTIYNWINRDDKLQEQTLHTLAHEPFNKVRFLIFPKWFVYNHVDPDHFPFLKMTDGSFDFDRFDVIYFQKLESRISELDHMGIEADVILFHPYDHWGFAAMGAARDEQYLRYVSARLSAYKNIWWTMANEYDLFDPSLSQGKLPPKNWDHLGRGARRE